jgi:hypothetical protein
MRRARFVRLHLIVALLTLMLLIAINGLLSAGYPWWLWVLTAWAPLIVLHTAWARGLFASRFFDRSNKGS